MREEEFALPPLALLAEHKRFAEALVLHAQTEEQVLYPAAILVGELVASARRY